MTTPASTVRIFGWYLCALGLALVAIPNLLLPVFGMPSATDVWVHVTGMLVLFLGVYYLLAANAGLLSFFAWTVPIRLAVSIFFVAFVSLNLAPPVLLAFCLLDAVGALWTWHALRKAAVTSQLQT